MARSDAWKDFERQEKKSNYNPETYRRWYEKNREKKIAQVVEYQEKNIEKVRAGRQRRYLENREERLRKNHEYYYANQERLLVQKREYLLKKYGLTPEDYDRMVEEQDGRCAICAKEREALVVDHCHDTGRIRGLLCRACNGFLGVLGDTADDVRRVVRYLESE